MGGYHLYRQSTDRAAQKARAGMQENTLQFLGVLVTVLSR
jgi:hypothetical protein